MKKKNREKLRLITLRVCIGILCAFVIAVFIRSYYYRSKESNLDIKSRYTFTVDIDAYGDVIDEQYQTRAATYDDSNVINTMPDVSQVKTETVARTWLNEYVNQYMNEYLPYNKSVKRMTIDDINVLNEDEHTALISFSVILKNAASDYFLSWDGVTDDDRLKCEWVVSYYIDAHTDNTATVYVTSALSPEEYGIAQYNEKAALAADSENKTNASTDLLARYVIRDDILSVTYDDGEHYATVPVDVENLMYESGSTSTLKDGSYLITTSKTAFLFGGRMGSSKKVPVTLIYSDDKGVNWTSCELDNIYNAEDYYVDFFDENNGVIVCGYARTDNEKESYRIYQTANGGETWTTVGSGPANYILKGVMYVDENVGFFCYNYAEGMDGNLYMTKDGGKTFSKVTLPEQELDSTAKSSTASSTVADDELKWNDVYKEALVPTVDDKGIITVSGGHGSPSNDMRNGNIPYVKVSDIRNMRINVNPTNLVSIELAKRFWKTDNGKSNLCAWDLISPSRASSNIGEFAILLPGEEQIVLTKEVFVIRVHENDLGYSPFYLLWALSLTETRKQWQRVTLMQTNREDVGQRYKEILIPQPISKEWAETVSAPFRNYFTSIATAKKEFVLSTGNDKFTYIASVSAFEE